MIFLGSSRKNDELLAGIRDELRHWANQNNVDLWQFERISKQDWKRHEGLPTARICLRKVDECDLFIALFHNVYGTPLNYHAAHLALTDLELFEAISQGKKLRCYIIEPDRRNAELEALLALVRTIIPHSFAGTGNGKAVTQWIKDDIARHLSRDDIRQTIGPSTSRRYYAALTKMRWPDLVRLDGLQVLPTHLTASGAPLAPDEIAAMLDNVERMSEKLEKIDALSELLPYLSNHPYLDRSCAAHHSLWDRYCATWLDATAWRGYHNPMRLGRLAMLNSRIAVRCLIATAGDRERLSEVTLPDSPTIGDPEQWAGLFVLGGAAASEHYSMAKLQSDRQRRLVLQ